MNGILKNHFSSILSVVFTASKLVQKEKAHFVAFSFQRPILVTSGIARVDRKAERRVTF